MSGYISQIINLRGKCLELSFRKKQAALLSKYLCQTRRATKNPTTIIIKTNLQPFKSFQAPANALKRSSHHTHLKCIACVV